LPHLQRSDQLSAGLASQVTLDRAIEKQRESALRRESVH